MAVGRTNDCALVNMGSTYVEALLRHHWASKETTRMNGFAREIMHLVSWAFGRYLPTRDANG
ncbi:MAG: hypothetical protein J2P50_07180 [Hyphomicrobiaceae bacterium]|nr:hypothetical protein [Hyphomicrobiaceae bacterium]